MSFRNQVVLKDVSWEVKKGERVGLVGVNGAGKTTQLQIIMGKITPDGGELARAKNNMKIAYLKQEFDVEPTRTVREEFASVFKEAGRANARIAAIQEELEVSAAGLAQRRGAVPAWGLGLRYLHHRATGGATAGDQ